MFLFDCEGEKRRILEFVMMKFFKEGFYKTTVAELASELRISKKTIYKYFSSKEELLDEVINTLMRTGKANVDGISNGDGDALLKLIKLKEFFTSVFINLSPKFMGDIERYGQDKWRKIDEFRTELIQRNFVKIFEQGKKEKIFRDFNSKVVMTMMLSSFRTIVNPAFLINSNFSAPAGANMVYNFFFTGMVTEKGKFLLNKYKESLQDEE